jgi:hypothetical protein
MNFQLLAEPKHQSSETLQERPPHQIVPFEVAGKYCEVVEVPFDEIAFCSDHFQGGN